ncbi:MAG: hypothetical protein DI556_19000 [Rhodovulum sulfidophilum]|uniref:Uncharacterized protein n=1 Tax=Rhodovulum sulfidophilum TaxID=35806 RepID=A0A2W5N075_RHOSU|nr:MAG: hypothetical protein DI556_19000 [Rhodovulum sulfidophilum]
MTEFAALLTALRRPKILIRAARAGLVDYRRERDLKRLRRSEKAAPDATFGALLAEEDLLEAHRAAGEATYDPRRHIAVLTALLAEARLAQGAALA